MKLYFLSIASSLLMVFAVSKAGPSALSDAKAILTDTIVVNGKVWMKNNLALPVPNSFWYERDSIANQKYGRLYYYSAAQAMCPKGWHIPTETEWLEMMSSFQLDSMNALPALINGGKTGLNLTLAGYKSANSKSDLFGYRDQWGFYWTGTVRGEQVSYAVWLNSGTGKVTSNSYRRANAFSVRYVRD